MKLFEIKDINGPRPPDENFPGDQDNWTKKQDEDEYYPEYATKAQMKRIKQAEDKANFKYLGSGVNAFVYQEDDPENMDRVHRISSPADVTSYFLNRISDTPSVQNNPFLPKVIEKTNKIDVVQHTMEPLYKLLTIPIVNNTDLMRALFLRYFKGEGWVEQLRAAEDPEHIEAIEKEELLRFGGTHLGYEYVMAMLNFLETAIDKNDCTNIKDPQLCKAVQFISDITSELRGPVFTDMHAGNAMWRVNGSNIQLVIVDPIHIDR